MSALIGRIRSYSFCRRCSGAIHFTEWEHGKGEWLHDANTSEVCPGAATIQPDLSAVTHNPCICWGGISVQCVVHGVNSPPAGAS